MGSEPVMQKRKWARYKRGDADYSSDLRRALPTASGAARRVISTAVGADEALAIHGTSQLLVEEMMDATVGRQCRVMYFHPVRLVQFMLNSCKSLASSMGK